MGGAVSIEPQRTSGVTKFLFVITKEDRMYELFKKIALNGQDEEGIRHLFLGQKRDTLCLPEILLFIAKGKDPIFSHISVAPLSIIKEAFYFAMDVDTTQIDEKERIAMRKEMTLEDFYQFMSNIFMFSRLWEIFAAADDGIEDEYISREEFCRAKSKLENMGGVKIYREMTDAQWAKGFSYIDDSKDDQIEFSEFIQFCVKFIITPDEYLIKAISVCVIKRGSVYDLKPMSQKLLERRKTDATTSNAVSKMKQRSKTSLQSFSENGGDNSSMDKLKALKTSEEDDASFDSLIKNVKGSKNNIVRTFSDISSTHGYGDMPSPKDVRLLEKKASTDLTNLAINAWTDNRMSENNQQHYRKWTDQFSNKKRHQLREGSSEDFDFSTEQGGDNADGCMNVDGLDILTPPGHDIDDNESLQSIISATTLLSKVEDNNNSQPQNSRGCGMDSDHDSDFLDDFSIDSRFRPKGTSSNAYQNVPNIPGYAFGHLRQPTTLAPVEGSTDLKLFIKERIKRMESFHTAGMVDSLSCNVRRATERGPQSPNSPTNRSVGLSRAVSFNDDLSDDASELMSFCSESKFSAASSTAQSTANITTCTPRSNVVTSGEDDDSLCIKQQPVKLNIISLIENLILAQFETPDFHKENIYTEEEDDEYSVSMTSK